MSTLVTPVSTPDVEKLLALIAAQKERAGLRTIFPELSAIGYRCPYNTWLCNKPGYQMMMEQVIVHLNDEHFWPREKIADWVEKVAP